MDTIQALVWLLLILALPLKLFEKEIRQFVTECILALRAGWRKGILDAGGIDPGNPYLRNDEDTWIRINLSYRSDGVVRMTLASNYHILSRKADWVQTVRYCTPADVKRIEPYLLSVLDEDKSTYEKVTQLHVYMWRFPTTSSQVRGETACQSSTSI